MDLRPKDSHLFSIYIFIFSRLTFIRHTEAQTYEIEYLNAFVKQSNVCIFYIDKHTTYPLSMSLFIYWFQNKLR